MSGTLFSTLLRVDAKDSCRVGHQLVHLCVKLTPLKSVLRTRVACYTLPFLIRASLKLDALDPSADQ